MCGITGAVGPLRRDELESCLGMMLRSIAHRGPDDEGTWLGQLGSDAIGLAACRLAILDLSPAGHQPMVDDATGSVLVYNGELYNSPAIRDRLKQAGHGFRGRSDTEVVLRAYLEWGPDCVREFNGMFAFALWDGAASRLILARDHLGIKPLYYSLDGGLFLFGSEMRALLAGGLVSDGVDPIGLAGYLAFGAVQEPRTILADVCALPAGSLLEWVPGGTPAVSRYWSMPMPTRDGDTQDLVAEGRAIVRAAVERHLLSDVPVGVFLSSGLDSTAVLGVAAESSVDRVRSFTVAFPDAPDVDEGPFAAEIAGRFGVEHTQCTITEATAITWVEEGMTRMDQPAMDGFNTYLVSKAVAETGLKVALSGQGGDEMFGGYPSFVGVERWARRRRAARFLPADIRRAAARAMSRKHGRAVSSKAADLAVGTGDLVETYFDYRRLLSNDDMKLLGLSSTTLGLGPTYQPPEVDTSRWSIAGDPAATVGRLETRFYLGNMLLRDGDVFGMANSLEIRVPLLDRALVEWVSRVPGNIRMKNRRPDKWLLRSIFPELFDDAQLSRAKQGFSPPFSAWLLGPLRPLLEEGLGHTTASGLVDAAGVERIYEAFKSHPHSAAWSRVWTVATLGHWLARRATSRS